MKEPANLVLQLDSISIAIKGVIDSARGSVSYWLINIAIAGVLGLIKTYINTFLQKGFDLNYIIQDLIGLSFFYFKRFTLVEQEQLIFARLTPGYNFTWANNGSEPVDPPVPHMIDLTGIEKMITEIGLP